MSDPRLKQIKIKTGILKRVHKEKSVYENDVSVERIRLQKMIDSNKDEHDLTKQEEVINETIMMLPDCQKRINAAYNDLKALLQETEGELTDTEEFIVAKQLINDVNITI